MQGDGLVRRGLLKGDGDARVEMSEAKWEYCQDMVK